MHEQWDVVVAGGGAAGLSAALMLGRARRRVLVADAGSPRNRFAAHMHGVLGNEGTNPADLLARGRREAAGYGVEFTGDTVLQVTEVPDGLLVTLADGGVVQARALVVATGITDELPDIPGLSAQWGTGVLHCPYCHGWEVRDQRLGVLATSPMNLHQAELVRQWSDRLVLFTDGLGSLAPEAALRLRSRGVELITSPVVEVLSEDGRLTGVRTADEAIVELDAIFVAGIPRPHEGFLATLHLERRDNPWGSFIAVDATGRTSHPRVWAAGNVVEPGANLPLSIGAASMAGAMVNAALVTEEFDQAVAGGAQWPEIATPEFWEERYATTDRVWSGRVNHVLTEVAAGLPPGTALDLGCGEGGDVIWLAGQGWQATGVDVSATAAARGNEAARGAGLADRARFRAADAAIFDPAATYDRGTASFLHSSATATRTEILRRAAEWVAPGGHLLIITHAAAPPWADEHAHHHRFLSAAEEVVALDLDPDAWSVQVAEERTRQTTSPDGEPATLADGVVLLRRAGTPKAG